MSTQNFYCKNTSKIYAIGKDEDFAQYDCQVSLESLNWTPCDEYDRTSNRSYPSVIIAEKAKCFCVAGASIDITAKAKIVSGYWSGACFEFDCEVNIYDMNGNEIASYEGLDDVYNYIDTDAIIADNWTGNNGLSKIHAVRIYEAMHKAIKSLQEEAEKAFALCCTDTLACVAVFSNGEAIYERA